MARTPQIPPIEEGLNETEGAIEWETNRVSRSQRAQALHSRIIAKPNDSVLPMGFTAIKVGRGTPLGNPITVVPEGTNQSSPTECRRRAVAGAARLLAKETTDIAAVAKGAGLQPWSKRQSDVIELERRETELERLQSMLLANSTTRIALICPGCNAAQVKAGDCHAAAVRQEILNRVEQSDIQGGTHADTADPLVNTDTREACAKQAAHKLLEKMIANPAPPDMTNLAEQNLRTAIQSDLAQCMVPLQGQRLTQNEAKKIEVITNYVIKTVKARQPLGKLATDLRQYIGGGTASFIRRLQGRIGMLPERWRPPIPTPTADPILSTETLAPTQEEATQKQAAHHQARPATIDEVVGANKWHSRLELPKGTPHHTPRYSGVNRPKENEQGNGKAPIDPSRDHRGITPQEW